MRHCVAAATSEVRTVHWRSSSSRGTRSHTDRSQYHRPSIYEQAGSLHRLLDRSHEANWYYISPRFRTSTSLSSSDNTLIVPHLESVILLLLSVLLVMNTSALNTGLRSEVLQQIALLSTFALLALLGNAFLLVYLVRTRAWRRPVSVFVMGLAITDLLIVLCSMSTEILWEAFNEWVFGYWPCKLSTYVQCALFVSTACILMSMSFDRYAAITRPMSFFRTLSRSRRLIAASWLIGLLMAVPQLFIFVQVPTGSHVDGSPIYVCKSAGYTADWQRKLWVTWMAVILFFIPLVFIAFCYINIAITVWKSNFEDTMDRSLSSFKRPPTSAAPVARGFGAVERPLLLNASTNGRQRNAIERAKMKTIRLTICILAGYIVCWCPYFVLNLVNVWTDYAYRANIPPTLRTVANSMAWFSSCVNPLIYIAFLMPNKSLVCWKRSALKEEQLSMANRFSTATSTTAHSRKLAVETTTV